MTGHAPPDGAPADLTESFVDRDVRLWERKRAPVKTADLVLRARAESGRSLADIVLELRRLARGPGRLSPWEYVQGRLWDVAPEERPRFLTDNLHYPVLYAVGDRRYEAMAEDKWLAASLLRSAGIPAVRCLAVVDRSHRTWPGIAVARTGAELVDLCRAAVEAGESIFAKPVFWLGGYGALLIDAVEGSRLHLHYEGWIEAEALVRTGMGRWPYLLQICEPADPALACLSPRLAVVRIHVWMRDSGPELHWPVMRAPGRANAFTQTWLPGNLTYALDIETGRVVRAISQLPEGLVVHQEHPESGVALPGYSLPHWEAVLSLAERAARVFAPLRYQSVEIGLGRGGPVVVEVNAGGGFSTWQMASGRGVLEPRFVEFLDECGVRLKPAGWRRSRRLSLTGDDPFHWTRVRPVARLDGAAPVASGAASGVPGEGDGSSA